MIMKLPDRLTKALNAAPVVPLIQADKPAVAVATARALLEGGLTVHEVVMRTPAALDCVAAIRAEVPGAVVGAGTVLGGDHARDAADAGAAFLVSPGLHDSVVKVARERGLPLLPGVATATEAQAAWNLGLRAVKFFPASLAGGVPMLKALSSVFRDLRFMPTGGVSSENLAEFLALPAVLACGGSWLTPAPAIERGDWGSVTALAADARHIARQARAAG
jgi:2-dehydro-3-deoxyphosphogluconate aldolase/(4S)-4-hydroxy-2-oxoglutarate aldolase